jgi:hypothetical protein
VTPSTEMDTFVLRILQREVEFQCKAVVVARAGLAAGEKAHDVDATFIALQAILVAAANLSKLLWGSGGRKEAERTRLRESLAVADNSPLKDPDLRNDFEHFDSRVEKWFESSEHHNYIGRFVGPYGAVVGPATGDRFQHYDPDSGVATFWDHSVNLNDVLMEVYRVLPLAQAEARKPHWDEPPAGTR